METYLVYPAICQRQGAVVLLSFSHVGQNCCGGAGDVRQKGRGMRSRGGHGHGLWLLLEAVLVRGVVCEASGYASRQLFEFGPRLVARHSDGEDNDMMEG